MDDASDALDAYRAAAVTTINGVIESIRGVLVSDRHGDDLVDIARLFEARDFQSDPTPSSAKYPLIYRQARKTGNTATATAAYFLNMDMAWRTLTAAMADIEDDAKTAIAAAQTNLEVDAALAAAIFQFTAAAQGAGITL